MGVIAIGVGEPTGSLRPRWGKPTIAIASVVSAAVFVWIRAGTNMPTQFQGVCERLRAAGLAIVPQDVFCQPVSWTSRAAYLAASLLIAVGFVLPCLILAQSGGRLTSFLPLLVAPTVGYPQGLMFSARWWGSTTWPHGGMESTAVTMLVLAAPVGAAVYAKRRSRIPRAHPSLIPGIVAALACGAGVVGAVFVAQGILARHFGGPGGQFGIDGIVPPAIAIAVFGALLGPDRRWWPWSLVPTALFLSAGPSSALIVGPERLLDWSNFGIVVPLFAAGLVGSAWRPLATRLASVMPGEDAAGKAPSTLPGGSAGASAVRLRPAVVLNGFAAGLLAVSLIAFRGDQSAVRSATSMPTYLGARISVEDLRTKLDLRHAIAAMDTYRSANGTYEGFDAASASVADPSIAWTDGLPRQGSDSEHQGPVGIVSADRDEARVVALSASGAAFCLQRVGGGLSYGRGMRDGLGNGIQAATAQAVAACGSTPWSASAIRRFPYATMCVGVEPDQYVLCRVVQVLMTRTMNGAESA